MDGLLRNSQNIKSMKENESFMRLRQTFFMNLVSKNVWTNEDILDRSLVCHNHTPIL